MAVLNILKWILNFLKRLVEKLKLPLLQPGNTSRVVTDVFRGYNHNLKIADGEMYDTENLTSDYFPMLARRKPRRVKAQLTDPSGLLGADKLIYIDDDRLYVDGVATELTMSVSYNKRQLVRMGHYVVIFPDNLYYNLGNPSDRGSLDASTIEEGTVSWAPCDVDGNIYTITTEADTEPVNPQNGEYWLNTADNTLMRYSLTQITWVKVETVYTKITFPSRGVLPGLFKEGDGVEIAWMEPEDLNGTKYLYGIGGDDSTDDYIIVIGLVSAGSQQNAHVTIKREAPAMDYVIECQNRLWGCRYYDGTGMETINEIYCSALGDFKNWRQYQGLSTDSWAASIGAPGPWTGAISYLGKPVFFKEDRVYTITVSPQGAHRIDETPCRGVEQGGYRSLCVVGETLYYKAKSDIMAWQGGFPASVSGSVFGGNEYQAAVGGAYGTKYYLSMSHREDPSTDDLFVYDIARGFWLREDDLGVYFMATVGNKLWAVDNDKRLLELTGVGEGQDEAEIPWSMETGIQYYEYPDKKYASRFNIRLQMAEGASAKIYLEYDSSGEWIEHGTVQIGGTGTVTVPIRPRRCDHLRMKLEGTGDFKILSIARILEVGSDV